MTTIWQQVFALDARYNASRTPNQTNFRTLYIRRRNQLLKESLQNKYTSHRKQYLKIRSFLLQQRYGNSVGVTSTYDQHSVRSRSIRSMSRLSDTKESVLKSQSSVGEIEMNSVVPTKEAEASRAIVGGNTISENYAFVGVHHIFDQHTSSVTMIKFANNDRSRLCCASYDGTVSICNVLSEPPTVDMILKAHGKAATSCDWSISNDFVVSCGIDCTIRLWDSYTGRCLRIVHDETNSEILSCVFQPANNNIVIAGNAKGIVSVLNVSTGIYYKGGSNKMGGKVTSVACDSSGNLVWAGNDKGVIMSYHFEPGSGKLQKKKKVLVADNSPITCISYRAWISREARDPSLLVNCAANIICLYRVTDSEGSLQLKRKYPLRHKTEPIRSTFCPIMSFRQGACIVTGSEDSSVYFLDIEKEERAVVNKLQGHACPVVGVSFNYDESLLATSDAQGLIIIWRRAT